MGALFICSHFCLTECIIQVSMSKLDESEAGFSIVELLITLIVIGIAFGAFVVTFTSIQGINKKAIDVNNANESAYTKLEEYENKDFANIASTTPSGTLVEVEDFSSSLNTTLPKPRSAKVYINTKSPTLKHIVVSIKFGSGDSERVIEFASLIQKNGLGR
jgi:prepilin-type N-terminal cleavage/methylation domain-containing protein